LNKKISILGIDHSRALVT